MKFSVKKIITLLLVCSILCGMLLMTSCAVQESTSLSKKEVEEMINNRLDGNITVEGGDNHNITINPDTSANILAASKALLSAVTVNANFEMAYNPGLGTNTSSRKYSSAGSGVIYKLDKEHGNAYVITNYHVVFDARANTENRISNDIKLYLYGQEFPQYAIPATFVGGSMNYDIAILKIEKNRVLAESNAMAATFADSNLVSVLDTAIAVGNPEAKGISATVGYVNVDSEQLTLLGADNQTTIRVRVMRIDTAVNSGNSGGGLYNEKGELIGIVNAKMSEKVAANIGYAIPSNVVKYIADNIIYYCDGTEKETVYRTIIGITVKGVSNYTVYDQESGKVLKKEKVAVDAVNSTGVASGKLQENDIINSVTIDGKTYTIDRTFILIDCMLNVRVGSDVTFNITRGDDTFDVKIEITEDSLVPYA